MTKELTKLESIFLENVDLTSGNGNAATKTKQTYTRAIAIFFEWCMATNTEPSTVDVYKLKVYRSYLIGKYKVATIRLCLLACRLLFDAMIRYGKRSDNPAVGFKPPKDNTSKAVRIIQKALRPDDLKKFIALLLTVKIRDKIMLKLMFNCGMRVQEVCQIRHSDFKDGLIMVLGKGNKERLVAYYVGLEKDLQEYKQYATNEYMFHGSSASHITTRQIQRITNKYLRQVNINEGSCHQLRHSFALYSLLGGASREALGNTLGHQNLSTTDEYIRAAAILQNNPVEVFNDYIKGL